MARVWHRLAATAFSVSLVVVLSQCKGLKPTPGSPCVSNGKYQCTDPATALLCQGSKMVTMPCRGPKGCWIDNNRVYCDQNMARIGDKCRPVDNHSCSEDSTQELKCSPQFTWIKQHDCKHSGCKIKNSEV